MNLGILTIPISGLELTCPIECNLYKGRIMAATALVLFAKIILLFFIIKYFLTKRTRKDTSDTSTSISDDSTKTINEIVEVFFIVSRISQENSPLFEAINTLEFFDKFFRNFSVSLVIWRSDRNQRSDSRPG